MLQTVMTLVSFGLIVWLAVEMWQRFDWAKLLMKAVLRHGVVAFIGCTVLMFLSIPFLSGLGGLILMVIYVFCMPIIVLMSVLSGMERIHDEEGLSGKPQVYVEHLMTHNDTLNGDYYDAF